MEHPPTSPGKDTQSGPMPHPRHQSTISLALAGTALATVACSGLCGRVVFDNPTPPERDFALAALFLNDDDLPYGWAPLGEPHPACRVSPLGSGCPTYAENLEYYYLDGDHRASETIYHFLSAAEASASFEGIVHDAFSVRHNDQPWQPPPDVPFDDGSAYNSHFACREGRLGRECQLALQHEEFITVFFVQADLLSTEELSKLLGTVEDRIGSLIR